MTIALIIIDYQEDFCEGGALPVKGARSLLDRINNSINYALNKHWEIIFTRDWHPITHSSFAEYGGPWPVHCVMHSDGAKFIKGVYVPTTSTVISKGCSEEGMGYSPFENKELVSLISEKKISSIICCGVALEFCVRATCIDARDAGLDVTLCEDTIASISDGVDANKVWNEISVNGCNIVKTISDI
ncbi:MAG: isochorismatase family protein [Gammaproteobacteria bacterium]|nr:isochorismatase family protein [Gammaproteobacteria bacterium]